MIFVINLNLIHNKKILKLQEWKNCLWIYRGYNKRYNVKIGHRINFDEKCIIKFGINTKGIISRSSFLGIGIKITDNHQEEHSFDNILFSLGRQPSHVFDYFDDNFGDIWREMRNNNKTWFKRGDVIINELNTKRKTVIWHIDGENND